MKKTTTLLLVLLLLQMLILVVNGGVTDEDLNLAIYSLISSGYNLFGNAIATSDLRDEILLLPSNNTTFTFFAPTDSSLYSLDMESTDIDYIQKLRYHIVTTRLTMSDLQDLSPNGTYFETLMVIPHHHHHRCRLLISNSQDLMSPGWFFNGGSVTVNGIEVSTPDLHIGSDITVHGLASILPIDDYPVPGVNDTNGGDLGFLAPSAWPGDLFPSPVSSPAISPAPTSSISPASSPDMFPVTPVNPPETTESIPPAVSPATDSIAPAVSPARDSITPVSPPSTDSITPAQAPIPSENSPSPAPVPAERNGNAKSNTKRHGKHLHHDHHHHDHHNHHDHHHHRHGGRHREVHDRHREIHDRGSSGRFLWSNRLCNFQCYE